MLSETEIDEQLPFDDSTSSNRHKLLQLLSSFETRTKIPAVTIGQFISQTIRLVTTGSRLPKPDEFAEIKIPGMPNPHRRSVEYLRLLDEKSEITRRRSLYLELQPQVLEAGAKLIFDALPDKTCPYGLPVYATAQVKRNLAKIARKNRVTLMSWPDLPNEVFQTAPDLLKNVWLLNFK